MNNIPFRSDQVVEELVQFNQNLSKGVKNLLDAEEISAGPRVKRFMPRTSSSSIVTSHRPAWYKTRFRR
jgi:hypothetical protein